MEQINTDVNDTNEDLRVFVLARRTQAVRRSVEQYQVMLAKASQETPVSTLVHRAARAWVLSSLHTSYQQVSLMADGQEMSSAASLGERSQQFTVTGGPAYKATIRVVVDATSEARVESNRGEVMSLGAYLDAIPTLADYRSSDIEYQTALQ